MILIEELCIKLIVAFFIGLLIGLERQHRNKHAGMRTFAILSMASCFLAILSSVLPPPFGTSNILAVVIVGISFLGAGVIYKEKREEKELVIRGLTTSVTLLMTSILGVAIGLGYIYQAIITASFTIFTLIIVRIIEIKTGLKQE